jgi:hypothetical protein
MKFKRISKMSLVGLSALCLACCALASHPDARIQGRQRNTPRQAPMGGGGQAHAQRENVRTPNFVPRTSTPYVPRQAPAQNRSSAGAFPLPRQSTPPRGNPVHMVRPQNSPQVQSHRQFTKTAQGRHYDNGLQLRRGIVVTASWQRAYFPRGHYHFPFYRSGYVAGAVFLSPFGFYYGICVPYIAATDCHVFPPSVSFVDEPEYNGVNCIGFADTQDQNYFDDPNLDSDEPGLVNAINEINETFQNGNVDALVSLIDPNMSVAVYLRGHYKYSLAANDFVDLTRDAIQSTQTVQFTLNMLHQRAPNVFSVSGTNVYRDHSGNSRTVYVSYVLQDISGQWTLTQVGTAPDRIQKYH